MNPKQYIKKYFPSLFYRLKTVNRWITPVRQMGLVPYFKDLFTYYSAMRDNKVYLGPFRLANQLDPNKKPTMEAFIRREVKDNFMLLEIGSWVGASALLWAEICKDSGGKVFCVDPLYVHGDYDIPRKYWQILNTGKIAKTFIHNVYASKLNTVIIPMLGKSEVVLPIFKQETFDVIYIDGSHTYENCLKDIRNSMPLIKEGGGIVWR